MSTSLSSHAFGLRGYRHVATTFQEGGVIFRIARDVEGCRRAACGSADVPPRGHVERSFRRPPLGRRPVTAVLPIPRVQCRARGVIRQVAVDFAEPRRSFTKVFARYALELSRLMTIQDVARHPGVSWDVIKDIVRQDLQRRFSKPKLRHSRQLASDEIRVSAGHRDLTLVLDPESGAVARIGRGQGGQAPEAFWKRLWRAHAQVEAVATDMSPASTEAARTHLPNATLVFDRFHVLKPCHDKLAALCRPPDHQATREGKKVLKAVRWLLAKRPGNLNVRRGERGRLREAWQLNEALATAYDLQEDLAEFWEQEDEDQATAFLRDWLARAETSGVKVLAGLAQTSRTHARGLMAYDDDPVSTGPLQGTNNKVKTRQRQAYGGRDEKFFRLKIFACQEAQYA